MAVSRNARARVRAEITGEIIAAARDELSLAGPVALSLRAVARRLDLVPSALYRYFPSRDALLTALIIEAYRSIGEAARAGRAAADPADPMACWLSVALTVRRWAQEHPHEWALVYGSPVPGYEAPEDTVEAALGITRVVAEIVRSAGSVTPVLEVPAPPGMSSVVEPAASLLLPGYPPELVVAAMMGWSQLIGLVSQELFGHFKGASTDFEAVFTYAMRLAGVAAGL